jgi:hypothetical protein
MQIERGLGRILSADGNNTVLVARVRYEITNPRGRDTAGGTVGSTRTRRWPPLAVRIHERTSCEPGQHHVTGGPFESHSESR